MISDHSMVALRKFLLRCLCLCVLVAAGLPTCAAGQGGQGDWWMFHHDPQHTGRSLFTGPVWPAQKWTFATGSSDFISSSPAIAADGTIYIGSDKLFAINPDGAQKWTFPAGGYIYASPAVGTDGIIYVGCETGDLYAVNADGSQKWAFPTGAIESSPAIGTDGTIYVGSYDLYAVNPDGTQKWAFPTNSYFQSSPAIGADGTIYIGAWDYNLYAINADGTLKWTFPTENWVNSSPAIGSDGTIYVGSDDGHVYAINPNGTLQWTYSTGAGIESSPAIGTDGTIYVGSEDAKLYAIHPDGTQKWAFSTGNYVDSSPALGTDGTIYVGSLDCNMYAINPDGTQKWAFQAGNSIASSPAIGADGTIYFGASDTHVYAITTMSFTVTASAGSNGTISPDTAQTVNYGSSLICTASPNAGYTVNSWSVDGTVVQSGGTTFTLNNITADHTVIVTFAPLADTIAITPMAGANGTINPSTAQTVTAGTNSTFTATPNPGYAVNTWSVDGTVAQIGDMTFTLSDITADHTVTVTFDYTGPSQQGDWWTFHHDRQHTGRSPFIGTALPVKKWAFPTGNDIEFSSAAISADGTLYVGSMDDHLYAINPNGTQQWAFPTGKGVESSPAIGSDGTIYVGSSDNNLYAINPTGTEKWTFPMGAAILSSPLIGPDGTIYVGSEDYNLYAINPDGTKKWAFPTGNAIYLPSPAISTDGTLYVGSSDDHLYAVNPDGTEKWAFPTGSYISSSPTIGPDGTIYIGSCDHNLYAIKPDGTQKWAFSTGFYVSSSPAIGPDGTLYVGSYDDYLYAINPDGTKKWAFPTGNYIFSSPAIGADGTIYVGSRDDNLYAINPDGTKKWAYATADEVDSSPAIGADGTLYVGSVDGHLYAFNSPLAVSLITSPASPQPINTRITLTASPIGGGGQLQYLFRAGYMDTAGWHWTNLNGNYTTTATCIWTPATAGSFTLVVWAREVGHTANYDAFASISYQINPTPLTTVALAATPTSPQPINSAITLTAIPTGGSGQAQYLFRVGYTNSSGWVWSNLNAGYMAIPTCTWKPTTVGTCTLVVWARLAGETVNYDKYATLTYQVTGQSLTAVALSATPVSPQPINTPITLTATPTGGSQVQYLFRVGYTNSTGWVWTNLNTGYTTTATGAWKPTTAGTCTLVVWARLVGETVNYDKYASITYQVTGQPLTAVTLSAAPTSPQPVNTPIKLTAVPTGGGGQVQYLFRAGYTDTAGWHWTNINGTYTTTATCTWTPTNAESYTLVVWARLVGHTANFDQYQAVPYQITTSATSSYFPLRPGSVYTYQVTATNGLDTGAASFSHSVQAMTSVQGIAVYPVASTGYSISGYISADPLTSYYNMVTNNSVSEIGYIDNDTLELFPTPETIIPTNTTAGTQWTWLDPNGILETFSVVDTETISVSGTTYTNALKIHRTVANNLTVADDFWYAQNVGLVQELYSYSSTSNGKAITITMTTVLVGYTPGS